MFKNKLMNCAQNINHAKEAESIFTGEYTPSKTDRRGGTIASAPCVNQSDVTSSA
jgi:hypothetical protein